MKFKAIIFDLDGTAIPNKPDGMPSKKVIDVVKEAMRKVQVSIATGRTVDNSREIRNALEITSPFIVAGGTQIIDPKDEKTLWKKELSAKQVKQIIDICLPYGYEIILGMDNGYITINDNNVLKPYQIVYVMNGKQHDVQEIEKKLAQVNNINIHEVISWKKDHLDIHITHKNAGKKHAMMELIKILGLDKKDIIVVGDSNNDKPLFEVAGYRVAMGNASDDLKSIADYIAPPVEEDGLAEVIQKFILESQ